ncbi:MAG: hypothetical protein M9962_14790 [Oligoflexia bacterium]|nr:hypothetical protein [Oligoflexia bacterium]
MLSLLGALVMSFSVYSAECVRLDGEYVARCPGANSSFSTEMFAQPPGCSAFSVQRIEYDAGGNPKQFWNPVWYPVGAGLLLTRETATHQYYEDRFYQGTALYTYYYRKDKSTGATVFERAESIDRLNNGNLLKTNGLASQTLFPINSCRTN